MLISQALRKGKENLKALGIGGIRKTLNQISTSNVRHGIEIMLSFMFLSLALLDTFLPFPGSPSRPQLELRPILLSSRTHTYI
ncbi:hypothetical protein PAHAL_7G154100 [Panicum hallii]|uniref:Uncharacterized protein n=1 Tax=Panicum hallii TaxID=206008 RepID=A0A2T8ICG3_9POAL|nr:hypothetical protein PAHAL_7G154100 [Panicum hallii]